ncbi:ABC transporter permease [Streptomyces sp. NPDC056161]|uniref:ABC transporter permease n=1 Tax=Streptomyces sp. NPDC056161 TaxID=3345732 RepID=UPI0035DB27A0
MTLHSVSAVTAHFATSYRRTWSNSAFNSFVLPVCLLVGLGWSLGRYVHDPAVGTSYLDYVAPGLYAGSAVQIAAVESAWPVFGGFEWSRTYHAIRNTPATVTDIMTGHLLCVLLKVMLAACGFLLVMTAFGIPRSWTTLLVLPVALLLGWAVAAPVFALSATIRRPGAYDVLFRLLVVPMTMLCGVYFPLNDLPQPWQGIAWALPLSQGAELSRMCVLGGWDTQRAVLDVLVLACWAGAGTALAVRAFNRRLSD